MTVNSGYGFPYPLSSEPVANGAANIQSLASAVDSKMGLFKVIPTGATNGTVSSDGDVTITAGATSVTVSGAFSSLFENYKIVWSGGSASAAGELGLQLGSSTANYYGFLTYGSYTASTLFGVNDSAQNRFRYVGGFDGFYCSLNCDIFGPFLARVTTINAQANYGAVSFGTYSGRHAEVVSYSSFTLIPNAGTLSGGTIRVYGYRN